MQNDLTLAAAREMTNEQLLGALRHGLTAAAAGIKHACTAIVVLEERGVTMPMLPEVYRYASEIADGNLSAHAALILARIPFAIKAIMALPIRLQDEVAEGKKIKVAVLDAGRVKSAEKTIFQMSQMQMRLAFGETGITPWEEQGSFLLKSASAAANVEAAKVDRAVIRVAAETREIVVNRTHVTVEDLIPALSALGYIVKPAYGATGIKPVKVS